MELEMKAFAQQCDTQIGSEKNNIIKYKFDTYP